jgi:hypothetical protein
VQRGHVDDRERDDQCPDGDHRQRATPRMKHRGGPRRIGEPDGLHRRGRADEPAVPEPEPEQDAQPSGAQPGHDNCHGDRQGHQEKHQWTGHPNPRSMRCGTLARAAGILGTGRRRLSFVAE